MIFRIVFIFLLFCATVYPQKIRESRTMGMFGKIRSGLEMAGKFLGLDTAKGVAELVSNAFGKNDHRKEDNEEGAGGNIFSGFLRMLGFDARRIGAIAVNSIVFIAQLIGKSLARSKPFLVSEVKKLPNGSPLDWVIEKPEVKSKMSYMVNPELPNDIVEYIKERSLDENTDCIQLLICKSAPFIWGMQRSLTGENSTVGGISALFQHLPSTEEFLTNGERCEKQHPYCFLDVY
ncbi:uncharacterized protein LOC123309884 [Coccinella septempunctata]|uniref:uncharacterized protein LOC123309884 n=1 Tax=Coccinella septempunctata TaxID=41139 RepID=UPI001D08F87D|nr:uncharacterized protein LOC123309884 [Coccinella septempunctata]